MPSFQFASGDFEHRLASSFEFFIFLRVLPSSEPAIVRSSDSWRTMAGYVRRQ